MALIKRFELMQTVRLAEDFTIRRCELRSDESSCEHLSEMVPPNICLARMKKEIMDLARNPPHGITCWSKNDRNDQLEAIIQGCSDTPYENGSFRLDITIPERYPMDPPQLKFVTKVYHPNIDNTTGLICLDLLKMPPQGKWRPIINLSALLTAVQQLLSDPNPHDPLDAAIAQEYISNRALFLENAKKWTQKYAVNNSSISQPKSKCDDGNSDTKGKARIKDDPAMSKQDTCEKSKNNLKRKTLTDDEVVSNEESKRSRAASPTHGE